MELEALPTVRPIPSEQTPLQIAWGLRGKGWTQRSGVKGSPVSARQRPHTCPCCDPNPQTLSAEGQAKQSLAMPGSSFALHPWQLSSPVYCSFVT